MRRIGLAVMLILSLTLATFGAEAQQTRSHFKTHSVTSAAPPEPRKTRGSPTHRTAGAWF